MRRAVRVLAVVTGLVLALVGTVAVAAWLSTGSASATASATSVSQAHAPTPNRGTGSVALSWTASTLASGAPVGGYRVLRHHGSDTPVQVCVTTSTSCTDTAPLATGVSYGVTATVGTSWSGPESVLTGFTYDDVAPSTTANVSPQPNAAAWNNTSVTVSLAATDTGSNPASGVDHLSYTIDQGSAVVVNAASTSFAVSGTGTHTVSYFAVDQAGNTEATKSLTVKIDPDAPVTTLTSPNPVPTWSKDPVTLQFSSADSGTSGLASITAAGTTTALTGSPSTATTSRTISAEGTTQVDYYATDVAGNVEGTKSVTVKIDKTAPSSTISPASSASWIQQANQSVTITGADTSGVTGGNSGVASVVYQVDSQQAVTTTSPATFSVGQGDHTITYHAVDVAGNVESDHVATIRVDNVAPSTSISPVSSTSTWQTANTATVSATDATSGVGSVAYKLNGAASFTTVAASSATVSGLVEGTNTIVYRATDKAGNVAADTTATIKVDTVRPTITPIAPVDGGSYKGNNGSWGKLCNNATVDGVCATIADTGGAAASGVDASTLRFTLVLNPGTAGAACWNGSSFVSGSACSVAMSFTASSGYAAGAVPNSKMAIGSYTLTYTAKDNAGNSALANSLSFVITN